MKKRDPVAIAVKDVLKLAATLGDVSEQSPDAPTPETLLLALRSFDHHRSVESAAGLVSALCHTFQLSVKHSGHDPETDRVVTEMLGAKRNRFNAGVAHVIKWYPYFWHSWPEPTLFKLAVGAGVLRDTDADREQFSAKLYEARTKLKRWRASR